ncbi:MAG TPA: tetratricopeptide repeat protein [Phycisphaerae bacterium]|nr:tetratricopeptide repeat protein [Phycisphaerae bacterium]
MLEAHKNTSIVFGLLVVLVAGCAQQTGSAPPNTLTPKADISSLVAPFGAEAQGITTSTMQASAGPKNTETLAQIQKDLGVISQQEIESNTGTQPSDKALRAFGLGRAAWLSGDDAEAQTFLEQARDEDPRSPTVLELLAQVYLDQGNIDAAIESLNAAEKIATYSLQANLMLGQIAYRKHDWMTTILNLLRAWNSPELEADSPYKPLIIFYLAVSLQNAGYHRAAADCFADCDELLSIPRPSFRMNRDVSDLISHKNAIEFFAGENAYAAGDYDGALEYYRRAQADGLSSILVLVRIAELEALEHNYNVAEQDALDLAYADGVVPQSSALIDWVWEQAGRENWIRDDLSQIGERSSGALFVLAMLEEQSGDWTDSYANLSRYLQDHPEDRRALIPLVALARQQQQIPEAYLLFAWVGAQDKISTDDITVDFLAMVGANPAPDLVSQLAAARESQTNETANGLYKCWQYYLLGIAAGEANQLESAVQYLRYAVEADPNFWPAAQLLARHLVELNEFQAAEKVVQARMDGPNKAAALAELVRVYIAEDRLQLAAQTAEKGIREYPDQPDCYLQAADIYDVQQDLQRESYALGRLIKQFPDLEEGYQRLLVFAANTQNQELQNALINRYITEFPDDSFAGILLARQRALQGDYIGAVQILERTIAMHPGDASVYLAMSELENAQGNQVESLAILEDAVKIDVNSVDLYVALAQDFEDMKQPEKAKAILAQAAREHPDSEQWQTAYVGLLDDLGEKSDVESQIAMLRAQEPDSRWVDLLYEQYLQETNQWVQAKQVLQHLCNTPYPNLTDLYDLAQVNLNLGDTDDEISTYQRILKISPYDANANNNLGYEWTLQGINLEEAKRMISIAVENYPNESAYHDSLGWVRFKLNDPHGALVELQMAVSLPGGQNPEGMQHLGDVLDALGETTEAIESWKTGLQILASQKQLSQDDLKTQKNLQERLKKAAPWIKLDELKPDNSM